MRLGYRATSAPATMKLKGIRKKVKGVEEAGRFEYQMIKIRAAIETMISGSQELRPISPKSANNLTPVPAARADISPTYFCLDSLSGSIDKKMAVNKAIAPVAGVK
ncbi:MAG: hypothetical protein ACM3PZ_00580 [Bacillota bacterium]